MKTKKKAKHLQIHPSNVFPCISQERVRRPGDLLLCRCSPPSSPVPELSSQIKLLSQHIWGAAPGPGLAPLLWTSVNLDEIHDPSDTRLLPPFLTVAPSRLWHREERSGAQWPRSAEETGVRWGAGTTDCYPPRPTPSIMSMKPPAVPPLSEVSVSLLGSSTPWGMYKFYHMCRDSPIIRTHSAVIHWNVSGT